MYTPVLLAAGLLATVGSAQTISSMSMNSTTTGIFQNSTTSSFSTTAASNTTTTSTSISTSSSASASPNFSALPSNTPLLVTVNAFVGKQKRQTIQGTFINGAGFITNDCTQAAVFTANNGQFFSNGLAISTTAGAANAPFAGSNPALPISITFGQANGDLVWANAAFVGGGAQFCQLSTTNQVLAVFNGANPANCNPVSLGVVPASACQANPAGGAGVNPGGLINPNAGIPASILNLFGGNQINYFACVNCNFYYVKLCSTCPIQQVSMGNNTYTTQPCNTCPTQVMQLAPPQVSNAQTVPAGVCATVSYAQPVCISCPSSAPYNNNSASTGSSSGSTGSGSTGSGSTGSGSTGSGSSGSGSTGSGSSGSSGSNPVSNAGTSGSGSSGSSGTGSSGTGSGSAANGKSASSSDATGFKAPSAFAALLIAMIAIA